MSAVNYSELFQLTLPQIIVVIAALLVLVIDVLFMHESDTRTRFVIGAMVSCVGCVGAIVWMQLAPHNADFLNGMLVVNPLTQLVQMALLALAVLAILISIESTFTDHVGEYLALILIATVGMMFLVSTEDILMIFISLELLSLSLYILTAFNKRNIKSAEAALKYFLFGGMSAAFTLFGLSLLYGLSGSTNLTQIAQSIKGPHLDPLLVVAIVMTVIGFGFKVAAVPFHLWAPDAYEGAPTPSAAFIASGSKVASFFIFAKVMMMGFEGAEGSGAFRNFEQGWVPVIAIVAALSMVLGNLAAIVQSSVKRLLAYSAIAHAGYALLAILSHTEQSVAALIYYVVTYGLTTLGAFGVVALVEETTGGDRLSNFAGFSRRAPVASFCMLIFMLSLAGIPPLAGFFGKFFIFTSAVTAEPKHLGLLWLVILAVAMSAVSLYYYLQVLKKIYISEPSADSKPVQLPVFSQVVLCLIALGVVLLGCLPNQVLAWLQEAIHVAGS